VNVLLNEVFDENLIDVQHCLYLLNYEWMMMMILKKMMTLMKHDDEYDYFDEDFDRIRDYLKLIKSKK
jgi:hypothetical protein